MPSSNRHTPIQSRSFKSLLVLLWQWWNAPKWRYHTDSNLSQDSMEKIMIARCHLGKAWDLEATKIPQQPVKEMSYLSQTTSPPRRKSENAASLDDPSISALFPKNVNPSDPFQMAPLKK